MSYLDFKKQAWFEGTPLENAGGKFAESIGLAPYPEQQQQPQATTGYRNPLRQPNFKPYPVGPVETVNVTNQNRSSRWKKDAPLLTAETTADRQARRRAMSPEAKAYYLFGYAPERQQQVVSAQRQTAATTPAPTQPQQATANAAQQPFPVNQYRIQIGANPALTWDENAFNGADDFGTIIQNAIPGLKEQLGKTVSFDMNDKYGEGYGQAVFAAKFGGEPTPEEVAAILRYHPDFANQIANSIYNIQDQNRANQLTDETLADGLSYFPDEQRKIISEAARARREWIPQQAEQAQIAEATQPEEISQTAPSVQQAGVPVNQTVSQSGTQPAQTAEGVTPSEDKPLLPEEPPNWFTSKDIFTKDRTKTYKEFLAMDAEKQQEFLNDPKNEELITNLMQYFGVGSGNSELPFIRLKAAIEAGDDESIALLGNDIMKLMAAAGDDTSKQSAVMETIKELFGGISEDQQNELKSAFQSKVWGAVASNPISNLPIAVSMFLRSIGLGGVADFTENPWIFYLGSIALFFGAGSLLAGDEQPMFNQGGYSDPRMSRVPYAF